MLDLDFVGYRGAAVHPYPATMPFPVAERLLLEHSTRGDLVFDPFAGSGTTLRAAVAQGRDAVGSDLNPLACLIARVTVGALTRSFMFSGLEELRQRTWSAVKDATDPRLPTASEMTRVRRWFTEATIEQLGRLAAAIAQTEASSYERDFLLLAFSRTIRKCSTARLGELKLWRRSGPIAPVDATTSFFEESLDLVATLAAIGSEGAVGPAVYSVRHGEAASVAGELDDVDLVLTSPPYGDAWTTVAYGNFTMLSRIWLGVVDPVYSESDPASEDELLPGGRLRVMTDSDAGKAMAASETLRDVYEQVCRESPERAQTMALFFADMQGIYAKIVGALARNATLVNVVGPRRVSGIVIDTGAIMSEILADLGMERSERFARRVTGKRLPKRTSRGGGRVDETINTETIDVLRPR